MQQTFVRSQVPDLVGLTRRQVTYLAEQGLVGPSVRGPSGRGSPTIYSYEDLRRLAALAALGRLAAGEILLGQARKALAALEQLAEGPWEGQLLVIDTELAYTIPAGELRAVLEHQGELVVVDLGRIERALGVQLRRHSLRAA